MQNLSITLVQAPLVWHNAEANIQYFSQLIKADVKTDLWILPEMFTSGFTMQPQLVAEKMDGQSASWMQKKALEVGAAICGSLVIEENGNYYNRLVIVKKDGTRSHYNKRHLFTMAGEHNHYTAGDTKLIEEINGWLINFQVCYDLRFPVYARNNKQNPYDLLIYAANWPVPRIAAWDKLLMARAIENQCFVAGVNRIGEDGNQHPYCGHSAVIDPFGEPLFEVNDQAWVKTIELSAEILLKFREKFPVLNDADLFDLK